ncbi:MAG: hypothetical protein C4290_15480, partial [Chloroflexota bacterium]
MAGGGAAGHLPGLRWGVAGAPYRAGSVHIVPPPRPVALRLVDAGREQPPVTLGEGQTPVVALPRWGEHVGLRRVSAKLEFLTPTGSFKDRGAAVLVTRARELGAGWLVEDSSGNAGAAIA